MKAMISNYDVVDITITGERTILRDGKPCRYSELDHEEQRYYDRVADNLYDLPHFDGQEIRTSFNVFTASAPAELTYQHEARQTRIGRYDYADLRAAALAPSATQADLERLAIWLTRYDASAWNGEYYDIDEGLTLRPTYSRLSDDEIIQTGWEVR